MKRAWVLPVIILVVLLGAGWFRWDDLITKTQNSDVYKWKVDRWTGQVWIQIFGYSPTSFTEDAYNADLEAARKTRDTLTTAWKVITGTTTTWFFFAGWIGPWVKERKSVKGVM